VPYEQDLSLYPEVFRKYQENRGYVDDLSEELEGRGWGEENQAGGFERRPLKDMDPWEAKYDNFMPKFTGTSSQ